MKLYHDTAVKVEESNMDPGQFAVLVSGPPYNSWLNVPCTFSSRDAAKRVAAAIVAEIPREEST